MNTNLHQYFLEPRNTRNNTEMGKYLFKCLPCFPWLKNNSAAPLANDELKDNSSLIIQNLSLGAAALLKEVQR